MVVIRPEMTQTQIVNPYFELLQGKRTPLEKLLLTNQRHLALASFLNKPEFQRVLETITKPLGLRVLQDEAGERTHAKWQAFLAANQQMDCHIMTAAERANLPEDYDYFETNWQTQDGQRLVILLSKPGTIVAEGHAFSPVEDMVQELTVGGRTLHYFASEKAMAQAAQARARVLESRQLGRRMDHWLNNQWALVQSKARRVINSQPVQDYLRGVKEGPYQLREHPLVIRQHPWQFITERHDNKYNPLKLIPRLLGVIFILAGMPVAVISLPILLPLSLANSAYLYWTVAITLLLGSLFLNWYQEQQKQFTANPESALILAARSSSFYISSAIQLHRLYNAVFFWAQLQIQPQDDETQFQEWLKNQPEAENPPTYADMVEELKTALSAFNTRALEPYEKRWQEKYGINPRTVTELISKVEQALSETYHWHFIEPNTPSPLAGTPAITAISSSKNIYIVAPLFQSLTPAEQLGALFKALCPSDQLPAKFVRELHAAVTCHMLETDMNRDLLSDYQDYMELKEKLFHAVDRWDHEAYKETYQSWITVLDRIRQRFDSLHADQRPFRQVAAYVKLQALFEEDRLFTWQAWNEPLAIAEPDFNQQDEAYLQQESRAIAAALSPREGKQKVQKLMESSTFPFHAKYILPAELPERKLTMGEGATTPYSHQERLLNDIRKLGSYTRAEAMVLIREDKPIILSRSFTAPDADASLRKAGYQHEAFGHFLAFKRLIKHPWYLEDMSTAVTVLPLWEEYGEALFAKYAYLFGPHGQELFAAGQALYVECGASLDNPRKLLEAAYGVLIRDPMQVHNARALIMDPMIMDPGAWQEQMDQINDFRQRTAGVVLAGYLAAFHADKQVNVLTQLVATYQVLDKLSPLPTEKEIQQALVSIPPVPAYDDERRYLKQLLQEVKEKGAQVQANLDQALGTGAGLVGVRTIIFKPVEADEKKQWSYNPGLNYLYGVKEDLQGFLDSPTQGADETRGLVACTVLPHRFGREMQTLVAQEKEGLKNNPWFTLLVESMDTPRVLGQSWSIYPGIKDWIIGYLHKRFHQDEPLTALTLRSRWPLPLQMIDSYIYRFFHAVDSKTYQDQDPFLKQPAVAAAMKKIQAAYHQVMTSTDPKISYGVIKDRIWPVFQDLIRLYQLNLKADYLFAREKLESADRDQLKRWHELTSQQKDKVEEKIEKAYQALSKQEQAQLDAYLNMMMEQAGKQYRKNSSRGNPNDRPSPVAPPKGWGDPLTPPLPPMALPEEDPASRVIDDLIENLDRLIEMTEILKNNIGALSRDTDQMNEGLPNAADKVSADQMEPEELASIKTTGTAIEQHTEELYQLGQTIKQRDIDLGRNAASMASSASSARHKVAGQSTEVKEGAQKIRDLGQTIKKQAHGLPPWYSAGDGQRDRVLNQLDELSTTANELLQELNSLKEKAGQLQQAGINLRNEIKKGKPQGEQSREHGKGEEDKAGPNDQGEDIEGLKAWVEDMEQGKEGEAKSDGDQPSPGNEDQPQPDLPPRDARSYVDDEGEPVIDHTLRIAVQQLVEKLIKLFPGRVNKPGKRYGSKTGSIGSRTIPDLFSGKANIYYEPQQKKGGKAPRAVYEIVVDLSNSTIFKDIDHDERGKSRVEFHEKFSDTMLAQEILAAAVLFEAIKQARPKVGKHGGKLDSEIVAFDDRAVIPIKLFDHQPESISQSPVFQRFRDNRTVLSDAEMEEIVRALYREFKRLGTNDVLALKAGIRRIRRHPFVQAEDTMYAGAGAKTAKVLMFFTDGNFANNKKIIQRIIRENPDIVIAPIAITTDTAIIQAMQETFGKDHTITIPNAEALPTIALEQLEELTQAALAQAETSGGVSYTFWTWFNFLRGKLNKSEVSYADYAQSHAWWFETLLVTLLGGIGFGLLWLSGWQAMTALSHAIAMSWLAFVIGHFDGRTSGKNQAYAALLAGLNILATMGMMSLAPALGLTFFSIILHLMLVGFSSHYLMNQWIQNGPRWKTRITLALERGLRGLPLDWMIFLAPLSMNALAAAGTGLVKLSMGAVVQSTRVPAGSGYTERPIYAGSHFYVRREGGKEYLVCYDNEAKWYLERNLTVPDAFTIKVERGPESLAESKLVPPLKKNAAYENEQNMGVIRQLLSHMAKSPQERQKDQHPWLEGPTGAGKDELLEYVAALTRRKLVVISIHEKLKEEDLISKREVITEVNDRGKREVKDIKFIKADYARAMTEPWNLVVLDELQKTNEDVEHLLGTHLSNQTVPRFDPVTGDLLKAEEPFNPNSMVVATGNPWEEPVYKSEAPKNDFLDRWFTVPVGYLKEKDERALLESLAPDLDSNVIKRLVQAAWEIRAKYYGYAHRQAMLDGEHRINGVGREVTKPIATSDLIGIAQYFETYPEDLENEPWTIISHFYSFAAAKDEIVKKAEERAKEEFEKQGFKDKTDFKLVLAPSAHQLGMEEVAEDTKALVWSMSPAQGGSSIAMDLPLENRTTGTSKQEVQHVKGDGFYETPGNLKIIYLVMKMLKMSREKKRFIHFFFVGHKGSGKSSLVRYLVRLLGGGYHINMHSKDFSTDEKLLGFPSVENGKPLVKLSPFAHSMQEGVPIFIEELQKGEEGDWAAISNALRTGRLYVPGYGLVVARPGWCVLADSLPATAMYPDVNVLPLDMQARLVTFEMGYPEPKDEVEILNQASEHKVAKPLLEALVSVINEIRTLALAPRQGSIRATRIDEPVSLRPLLHIVTELKSNVMRLPLVHSTRTLAEAVLDIFLNSEKSLQARPAVVWKIRELFQRFKLLPDGQDQDQDIQTLLELGKKPLVEGRPWAIKPPQSGDKALNSLLIRLQQTHVEAPALETIRLLRERIRQDMQAWPDKKFNAHLKTVKRWRQVQRIIRHVQENIPVPEVVAQALNSMTAAMNQLLEEYQWPNDTLSRPMRLPDAAPVESELEKNDLPGLIQIYRDDQTYSQTLMDQLNQQVDIALKALADGFLHDHLTEMRLLRGVQQALGEITKNVKVADPSAVQNLMKKINDGLIKSGCPNPDWQFESESGQQIEWKDYVNAINVYLPKTDKTIEEMRQILGTIFRGLVRQQSETTNSNYGSNVFREPIAYLLIQLQTRRSPEAIGKYAQQLKEELKASLELEAIPADSDQARELVNRLFWVKSELAQIRDGLAGNNAYEPDQCRDQLTDLMDRIEAATTRLKADQPAAPDVDAQRIQNLEEAIAKLKAKIEAAKRSQVWDQEKFAQAIDYMFKEIDQRKSLKNDPVVLALIKQLGQLTKVTGLSIEQHPAIQGIGEKLRGLILPTHGLATEAAARQAYIQFMSHNLSEYLQTATLDNNNEIVQLLTGSYDSPELLQLLATVKNVPKQFAEKIWNHLYDGLFRWPGNRSPEKIKQLAPLYEEAFVQFTLHNAPHQIDEIVEKIESLSTVYDNDLIPYVNALCRVANIWSLEGKLKEENQFTRLIAAWDDKHPFKPLAKAHDTEANAKELITYRNPPYLSNISELTNQLRADLADNGDRADEALVMATAHAIAQIGKAKTELTEQDHGVIQGFLELAVDKIGEPMYKLATDYYINNPPSTDVGQNALYELWQHIYASLANASLAEADALAGHLLKLLPLLSLHQLKDFIKSTTFPEKNVYQAHLMLEIILNEDVYPKLLGEDSNLMNVIPFLLKGLTQPHQGPENVDAQLFNENDARAYVERWARLALRHDYDSMAFDQLLEKTEIYSRAGYLSGNQIDYYQLLYAIAVIALTGEHGGEPIAQASINCLFGVHGTVKRLKTNNSREQEIKDKLINALKYYMCQTLAVYAPEKFHRDTRYSFALPIKDDVLPGLSGEAAAYMEPDVYKELNAEEKKSYTSYIDAAMSKEKAKTSGWLLPTHNANRLLHLAKRETAAGQGPNMPDATNPEAAQNNTKAVEAELASKEALLTFYKQVREDKQTIQAVSPKQTVVTAPAQAWDAEKLGAAIAFFEDHFNPLGDDQQDQMRALDLIAKIKGIEGIKLNGEPAVKKIWDVLWDKLPLAESATPEMIEALQETYVTFLKNNLTPPLTSSYDTELRRLFTSDTVRQIASTKLLGELGAVDATTAEGLSKVLKISTGELSNFSTSPNPDRDYQIAEDAYVKFMLNHPWPPSNIDQFIRDEFDFIKSENAKKPENVHRVNAFWRIVNGWALANDLSNQILAKELLAFNTPLKTEDPVRYFINTYGLLKLLDGTELIGLMNNLLPGFSQQIIPNEDAARVARALSQLQFSGIPGDEAAKRRMLDSAVFPFFANNMAAHPDMPKYFAQFLKNNPPENGVRFLIKVMDWVAGSDDPHAFFELLSLFISQYDLSPYENSPSVFMRLFQIIGKVSDDNLKLQHQVAEAVTHLIQSFDYASQTAILETTEQDHQHETPLQALVRLKVMMGKDFFDEAAKWGYDDVVANFYKEIPVLLEKVTRGNHPLISKYEAFKIIEQWVELLSQQPGFDAAAFLKKLKSYDNSQSGSQMFKQIYYLALLAEAQVRDDVNNNNTAGEVWHAILFPSADRPERGMRVYEEYFYLKFIMRRVPNALNTLISHRQERRDKKVLEGFMLALMSQDIWDAMRIELQSKTDQFLQELYPSLDHPILQPLANQLQFRLEQAKRAASAPALDFDSILNRINKDEPDILPLLDIVTDPRFWKNKESNGKPVIDSLADKIRTLIAQAGYNSKDKIELLEAAWTAYIKIIDSMLDDDSLKGKGLEEVKSAGDLTKTFMSPIYEKLGQIETLVKPDQQLIKTHMNLFVTLLEKHRDEIPQQELKILTYAIKAAYNLNWETRADQAFDSANAEATKGLISVSFENYLRFKAIEERVNPGRVLAITNHFSKSKNWKKLEPDQRTLLINWMAGLPKEKMAAAIKEVFVDGLRGLDDLTGVLSGSAWMIYLSHQNIEQLKTISKKDEDFFRFITSHNFEDYSKAYASLPYIEADPENPWWQDIYEAMLDEFRQGRIPPDFGKFIRHQKIPVMLTANSPSPEEIRTSLILALLYNGLIESDHQATKEDVALFLDDSIIQSLLDRLEDPEIMNALQNMELSGQLVPLLDQNVQVRYYQLLLSHFYSAIDTSHKPLALSLLSQATLLGNHKLTDDIAKLFNALEVAPDLQPVGFNDIDHRFKLNRQLAPYLVPTEQMPVRPELQDDRAAKTNAVLELQLEIMRQLTAVSLSDQGAEGAVIERVNDLVGKTRQQWENINRAKEMAQDDQAITALEKVQEELRQISATAQALASPASGAIAHRLFKMTNFLLRPLHLPEMTWNWYQPNAWWIETIWITAFSLLGMPLFMAFGWTGLPAFVSASTGAWSLFVALHMGDEKNPDNVYWAAGLGIFNITMMVLGLKLAVLLPVTIAPVIMITFFVVNAFSSHDALNKSLSQKERTFANYRWIELPMDHLRDLFNDQEEINQRHQWLDQSPMLRNLLINTTGLLLSLSPLKPKLDTAQITKIAFTHDWQTAYRYHVGWANSRSPLRVGESSRTGGPAWADVVVADGRPAIVLQPGSIEFENQSLTPALSQAERETPGLTQALINRLGMAHLELLVESISAQRPAAITYGRVIARHEMTPLQGLQAGVAAWLMLVQWTLAGLLMTAALPWTAVNPSQAWRRYSRSLIKAAGRVLRPVLFIPRKGYHGLRWMEMRLDSSA